MVFHSSLTLHSTRTLSFPMFCIAAGVFFKFMVVWRPMGIWDLVFSMQTAATILKLVFSGILSQNLCFKDDVSKAVTVWITALASFLDHMLFDMPLIQDTFVLLSFVLPTLKQHYTIAGEHGAAPQKKTTEEDEQTSVAERCTIQHGGNRSVVADLGSLIYQFPLIFIVKSSNRNPDPTVMLQSFYMPAQDRFMPL